MRQLMLAVVATMAGLAVAADSEEIPTAEFTHDAQ
jgi:hypothetical protein